MKRIGKRGIRTLGTPRGVHVLSRDALSATQPSFQKNKKKSTSLPDLPARSDMIFVSTNLRIAFCLENIKNNLR